MERLLADYPPDLDHPITDGALDRSTDTAGEAILAALDFLRAFKTAPRALIGGAE